MKTRWLIGALAIVSVWAVLAPVPSRAELCTTERVGQYVVTTCSGGAQGWSSRNGSGQVDTIWNYPRPAEPDTGFEDGYGGGPSALDILPYLDTRRFGYGMGEAPVDAWPDGDE